MPELPDVQVFKEYVDATSLHRPVETVSVTAPDLLVDTSERTLRSRLKGARLTGTRRHGKHLFCAVEDGGWLRLHFGMTGRPEAYEGDDEPEHTRLRLDFRDGRRLAYVNQRKFGEIGLLDDVDAFIQDRDLGPDFLDLDLPAFRERLEDRRGTIKGTLMNQEVVAGLGNIYVDEMLFQAGVHPRTGTADLDGDTVAELFRTARQVVETAIEARVDVDDMPEDWLLPRRDEGADCTRCGGTIQRTEVSGRATYLCEGHQAKGG